MAVGEGGEMGECAGERSAGRVAAGEEGEMGECVR